MVRLQFKQMTLIGIRCWFPVPEIGIRKPVSGTGWPDTLERYFFTIQAPITAKVCVSYIGHFHPRDAMLTRYAVIACLSVRTSVTSYSCIKAAKHMITQTTPHDSPETL